MNSAKQHYDQLLGDVFSWSVAAHGDPFARAADWLSTHHLDDQELYLDLGAGFGAHVLPLLRMGKRVTAVDFSPRLLNELRSAARSFESFLSIHEGDLIEFLERPPALHDAVRWDVVLCLGDTLPHLPDRAAVRRLIAAAAARLAPGGRVAFSYRDSSNFDPKGTERFIPVARDAHRVMHCFVEPIDAEHLRVTDLVTEFGARGPTTRLSEYVKLRLPLSVVVAYATQCDLQLEQQTVERGMTSLVFRAHAPLGAASGDGKLGYA